MTAPVQTVPASGAAPAVAAGPAAVPAPPVAPAGSGIAPDLLSPALAAVAAHGGLVLHLGAGTAPDLAACLAAGPAHVALVEADPALARALERRLAGVAGVSVHACAIAAQDGTATLRVFNHAPLSSLRDPADLVALFPGLRERHRIEVETCDPAGLLRRLPSGASRPDPDVGPDVGPDTGPDTGPDGDPGPDPDLPAPPGADLLIVDIPGEEAAALEALARAGALARFGRILLRCGTTAHYHGSLPLAALADWLEAAGYRDVGREDGDDPDRPWQAFRLDPLAGEVTRLRALADAHGAEAQALRADLERAGARASAAEAERARLEDALRALRETARETAREAGRAQEASRQEAAEARAALAERLAAREADAEDLQRRLAAAEAARARTEAEAAARIAAADHARTEAEARAAAADRASLEAQTAAQEMAATEAALQARLADQAAQLAERTEALAAAAAERDELTVRLQRHQGELERLRRVVEQTRTEAEDSRRALSARLEHAESEAARLRGEEMEVLRLDLAAAVRLQALREADLRDLQARHARLVDERDHQEALLRQLTERLSVAADYLRQLEPALSDALPDAAFGAPALQDPGSGPSAQAAVGRDDPAAPALPATAAARDGKGKGKTGGKTGGAGRKGRKGRKDAKAARR